MNRLSSHLGWIALLALSGTGGVAADESTFDSTLLRDDWLQSADQVRRQAVYGAFSSASGVSLGDPFTVVSGGTLWQGRSSVTYSRPVMDNLALSCAGSTTTQDGSPHTPGGAMRAQASWQAFNGLTLQGNVHDSTSDQSSSAPEIAGAGASIETHLPLDATFTAAVNGDHATGVANPGLDVETDAYDAQLNKPLGKLPLSLVLKSHYVETDSPGAGATRIPSFEQSLVWKPAADTTLQAGLRRRQYQNFPGIDDELNEALFADWSQNLAGNLSWHSYAEMINSRSTVEIAEAGAGENGTAQPNTPNGGASATSALPVSTTDEKLTFSTGPSLKLRQDLSASLDYSGTFDQNPAPGGVGQEQRVSLSLKGSF